MVWYNIYICAYFHSQSWIKSFTCRERSRCFCVQRRSPSEGSHPNHVNHTDSPTMVFRSAPHHLTPATMVTLEMKCCLSVIMRCHCPVSEGPSTRLGCLATDSSGRSADHSPSPWRSTYPWWVLSEIHVSNHIVYKTYKSQFIVTSVRGQLHGGQRYQSSTQK